MIFKKETRLNQVAKNKIFNKNECCKKKQNFLLKGLISKKGPLSQNLRQNINRLICDSIGGRIRLFFFICVTIQWTPPCKFLASFVNPFIGNCKTKKF